MSRYCQFYEAEAYTALKDLLLDTENLKGDYLASPSPTSSVHFFVNQCSLMQYLSMLC